MASTTKLPSGRYRGRFRVNGVQHTKTFDYEFEAQAWAESGEARAVQTFGPTEHGNPDGGYRVTVPATNDNGTQAAAPQVTVAQYGRAWLARSTGGREVASTNWYDTQFRLGIAKTRLGRMPLVNVRKADVEQWMTDQVGKVGTPTRVARLKTLRKILNDAIDNELIVRDPSRAIPKPTPDERLPPRASAEQLDALLAALGDEHGLFFLLGLDAGLRWGEAAGLTAEAVRFDNDNPRIWVGRVALRSGKLRDYPKGHRARWVPITTDRLADALRARIEAVGGSGLLMTRADGVTPVSYFATRDRWETAREAAGVPTLRLHDMRHLFGSDLGNAGMPRRDIATVLGHADEKTTAGYMHGNDDATMFAKARAAKAVAK
jgi:integrase